MPYFLRNRTITDCFKFFNKCYLSARVDQNGYNDNSCVTTNWVFKSIGRHVHNNHNNQTIAINSNSNHTIKKPFESRSELKNAQRIVVKLGSAVITREDECGLALGRLASIVEQVSQLHHEGKDVLMVTSGAVAFGKQRLGEAMRMSKSMRETLSPRDRLRNSETLSMLETRAAAAVGQCGLMALYDAMFAQYGVNIAQVLVSRPDFNSAVMRYNVHSTLCELLKLNIIPIVNANDAIVAPAVKDMDLSSDVGSKALDDNPHHGLIIIEDNDSLAAHLAVEAGADALILMSNVNGIYTLPPNEPESRLLHTYSPNNNGVVFGGKSKVGLGGMDSKVASACWALERGVSVVICNGMENQAITRIMSGNRVGTFFTRTQHNTVDVETIACKARKASQKLESLTPEQRSHIILTIAQLLKTKSEQILIENNRDIRAAQLSGLEPSLLSRLTLTLDKLNSLSAGLEQIASQSHNIMGHCLRHTLISDGLVLKQITVPLGVLLVIFESRPDCLPQLAALSIATCNGLLAKGGKEATHSNQCLFGIIRQALSQYGVEDAVEMINNREDVSDLLQLDNCIDLVIPRGSNELVRSIQQQSRSIPVLGHSEGICHVYIDVKANIDLAMNIVVDSKCDYPSACNAMETLLMHRSLVDTELFVNICNKLKECGVKIYSGPRLSSLLTFGPPRAASLRTEYSSLSCTIELVDDVIDAIDHINRYGSGHTDVIVTEDADTSRTFQKNVDSACVFHNCSTRFSDGYRFGLGAEVGISTGKIHARGPVGMHGLLSTKWILNGNGNIVSDFSKGNATYKHHSLPITETSNL